MENLEELVRSLAGEDETVSVEELLNAAAALPDEHAAAQAKWEGEKREFLLKEVFWKAGAKEADYLAYRYRGEASFNEKGGVENGAELVGKAKEDLPEFFPKRSVRLSGVKPQEGKSPANAPASLSGMSYAQRAELLARDPEMYRRLREL